jgi:hypothetical protein
MLSLGTSNLGFQNTYEIWNIETQTGELCDNEIWIMNTYKTNHL